MAKTIDLSDGGPKLSWFTSPKTFPTNLKNSFGDYQQNTGIHGPRGTMVNGYASPVAPVNQLNIGVLFDARNRVAF